MKDGTVGISWWCRSQNEKLNQTIVSIYRAALIRYSIEPRFDSQRAVTPAVTSDNQEYHVMMNDVGTFIRLPEHGWGPPMTVPLYRDSRLDTTAPRRRNRKLPFTLPCGLSGTPRRRENRRFLYSSSNLEATTLSSPSEFSITSGSHRIMALQALECPWTAACL